MTNWQPIETAPKDGTRVLIGYVAGFVGCACFHTRPLPGWYRDGGGIGANPTDWQPLPEPPEAVQKRSTKMSIPLTDWSGPRHFAKPHLIEQATELLEKIDVEIGLRGKPMYRLATYAGVGPLTANAFLEGRTVSESSAVLIHKWIENANAKPGL